MLWAQPIIKYLGEVIDDWLETKRLKHRGKLYVVMAEVLYKRGFLRPLLKCVSEQEVDYIMRKIHKGIYGNHSGRTTTSQ